ncbi:AraC family transcriptional regulator [Lysinibacillus macroides]|uniref:AraC family transcriptional regulator n=2 Tax=Lysinibacillus macroides TaxID=33935 RepID=A0A0M9DN09_9BACI|nr:AraC family transcriptional regulator [Lysinibacillus macroides]
MDVNKLAEHFAHTAFQLKAVRRFEREPGMWFNDYSEPFPGFVFPLQGKAEFVFNGTPYIVRTGNIVHGGAQMQLDRRVIGTTKWEYLLVLYNVLGNEPKDFSLSSTHFELQTGQSPRLTELLQQLWRTSNETGGIHAFRTETLFRCVLDEMFVNVRNQTKDDTRALFEQIVSYVHDHYMDSLTVGMLAQQYNMNENRLFYLFQKYVGMGPWEYLAAYRLNRAKKLLLQLDIPIYVIAKSIGYADPYYFSRVFKKQFGISPNNFREKFKNNPC